MLKISYAGCFGLSSAISAQFAFNMCVATRNRETFTKNPLFRGFMVVQNHGDISKKLVVSAHNKQHICA